MSGLNGLNDEGAPPPIDPSHPIRLYVVDDHPVVREGLVGGLSRLEDVTVVGSSGSAEEALSQLTGVEADVVMVDYSLPGADGSQLVSRLAAPPYELACLILTSADAPETVRACLAAGAKGYLLKDASLAAIATAVRALARGEAYIDLRVTDAMRELDRRTSRNSPRLTEREHEVLLLIAAGMSNAEIASYLKVSTGSAKNYVSRLLVKLGVSRRAEAVATAARSGLL